MARNKNSLTIRLAHIGGCKPSEVIHRFHEAVVHENLELIGIFLPNKDISNISGNDTSLSLVKRRTNSEN